MGGKRARGGLLAARSHDSFHRQASLVEPVPVPAPSPPADDALVDHDERQALMTVASQARRLRIAERRLRDQKAAAIRTARQAGLTWREIAQLLEMPLATLHREWKHVDALRGPL